MFAEGEAPKGWTPEGQMRAMGEYGRPGIVETQAIAEEPRKAEIQEEKLLQRMEREPEKVGAPE